jgi:2-(1,2-epoxy-1,2-dihydrophenyl)acetyl-CoA isomerase
MSGDAMERDYETLEVETAESVTTVKLNRPDSLNAIDRRMGDELVDLLEAVDADDETRVVVLTGSGRGFCAGADVADLAQAASGDQEWRPADMRQVMRANSVRVARALMEFEKPLVGAVNGPCAGAGVGLALACDVLVASEDASFSVVFVRRGLVPDYGVTYLLPRLVGLRTARELCLSGDKRTAAEWAELGLVSRVVDGDDLLASAQAEAGRLAAGAGVALRLTKRLLNESFDLDYSTVLDREFTYQALCFASADAQEGVQAFMERRDPHFSWR